jgi:hypothetical protein
MVSRGCQRYKAPLPGLAKAQIDKLQAYIDTTSQLGGWSANCVQVGNSKMVLSAPGGGGRAEKGRSRLEDLDWLKAPGIGGAALASAYHQPM